MTGLGVLLPLIVTFIAGPLSKGDNTQVTGINSEVLKSSHNITERAAECPEDLHREGEFCCQLCPPGVNMESVRIAHQPTTPNVKDPDLTFCGSSSSSSSRF
uniref:Fas cell surface death receptor n=1 Tax=Rousettus aegyptiacus TaxID=9407 RepID=A0A7J8G984_ROUAE|nr:Fas cell surface death receptor [Rousettus aegyptiacus]